MQVFKIKKKYKKKLTSDFSPLFTRIFSLLFLFPSKMCWGLVCPLDWPHPIPQPWPYAWRMNELRWMNAAPSNPPLGEGGGGCCTFSLGGEGYLGGGGGGGGGGVGSCPHPQIHLCKKLNFLVTLYGGWRRLNETAQMATSWTRWTTRITWTPCQVSLSTFQDSICKNNAEKLNANILSSKKTSKIYYHFLIIPSPPPHFFCYLRN